MTTDCEEGLREGPDRERQRMSNGRGVSPSGPLHHDGVCLPTLHQQ